MKNHEDLQKQVEKKYKQRDRKKKPKMKVSGKGVFKLKEIIKKRNDRTHKRKNHQKNK